VGVQIAEDEPATVEVDHERVRPSVLFGSVVPRGEWPGGAFDEQIPHGTYGGRRAVRHGDPARVRLAGFDEGEGFKRGNTPTLEQREGELYLALQDLAVYTHRGAAREQNLGPRRQHGEEAGGSYSRRWRTARPIPGRGWPLRGDAKTPSKASR
jgi:hypothetical protein